MATRPPFLNTPYGAYEQRDIPKEDEELLHVGPGTPGGEYVRRFWQPVAYAEELQDLPLRIRILGEDLVVFRDRSERVGLRSSLVAIAAPHWSSASCASGGSAAAIMAGSSMSMAGCLRPQENRRTAR